MKSLSSLTSDKRFYGLLAHESFETCWHARPFMLHFLFPFVSLSLNLRDESSCYTEDRNLVQCAYLVPKCLVLIPSCVFLCILNSQMDCCSSSKVINSQTFHINLLFFSLRTSKFTLKNKFGISVTVLQWFAIRKKRCKALLYNCVLAC